MFEFIGFMLGIQYGEKVFNLLGVLLRGVVTFLSFFAWLSAWDLLMQYMYISTMYKIIAIALMAVSYTHLDVYKRQGEGRFLCPHEGEGTGNVLAGVKGRQRGIPGDSARTFSGRKAYPDR